MTSLATMRSCPGIEDEQVQSLPPSCSQDGPLDTLDVTCHGNLSRGSWWAFPWKQLRQDFFFRAAPVACRSFQARGQIGGAAASLHHGYSNTGSKLICDLHFSVGQCHVLNPLSEARDQTHILMGTSQVLNPLSHNRNPLRRDFMNKP